LFDKAGLKPLPAEPGEWFSRCFLLLFSGGELRLPWGSATGYDSARSFRRQDGDGMSRVAIRTQQARLYCSRAEMSDFLPREGSYFTPREV